jgi:hypothetical protein
LSHGWLIFAFLGGVAVVIYLIEINRIRERMLQRYRSALHMIYMVQRGWLHPPFLMFKSFTHNIEYADGLPLCNDTESDR